MRTISLRSAQLYDLRLAGYSFSFSSQMNGMLIRAGGYSADLEKVLKFGVERGERFVLYLDHP